MATDIRISKKYTGDRNAAQKELEAKLKATGLVWRSYPSGASGWEGSNEQRAEAGKHYEIVQFHEGHGSVESTMYVLPKEKEQKAKLEVVDCGDMIPEDLLTLDRYIAENVYMENEDGDTYEIDADGDVMVDGEREPSSAESEAFFGALSKWKDTLPQKFQGQYFVLFVNAHIRSLLDEEGTTMGPAAVYSTEQEAERASKKFLEDEPLRYNHQSQRVVTASDLI